MERASERKLVVAQDGRGDFSTVQDAIDAVPLANRDRIVIEILPGVYRQPVYVPKTKDFITLRGFCAEDTILTCKNTATCIEHHQAARVIGTGTFGCGTVIVEGHDFIAEGITFENASPQGSGQAVAIRVTADRCAFYSCRFLGWQDTAYLHYGKHYLRDCYIEGSVDFIFGNATALLENCHIHCKSQGFITAHSRKSAEESTGYVFLRILRKTWSGMLVLICCWIDHVSAIGLLNAAEVLHGEHCVSSLAVEETVACILDGHGHHLAEWYLHIHGWMHASNQRAGITGINLKMKEVLASMNTGAQAQEATHQKEFIGQGS
ncbi:pectinesterase 31 isoform X2 [Cryptomeria japonica]|uniref:pectinesterase 31 isoform X2 n=1 Tax=Cryptomeria japonica TaxID=3369 RepID=UPI0025ACA9BE|nr:pectinesterase 31 isoform X2 [Cryptomeria japonica]